jgi:hypothetical protein
MDYSQFKEFMMNEFFKIDNKARIDTPGKQKKIFVIRGTFKNRAEGERLLTL